MAVNVLRLMALCRREQVQIIHARSRAPAWVALGAARRLGLPFVTTYHGSYSGRTNVKVLYNSVMARGDVVIANSHYTADLIHRLHAEQAGDRVRVIHRGTDLGVFNPVAVGAVRVEALRRSWNVAPHERVILLAARLTAWKGHRVLIEAAAQMRDRGVPDLAVVLAGDPQGRASYERELDALIAARGLEGIVRRVGHCTDMPAAFRAASVVAVPSVEPEAFGRSAVEAQALGTPVVVSDLGAVPETVLAPPETPAGQRTGWRVPAGDAAALAASLTEALSLGASARDALGGGAVRMSRRISPSSAWSATRWRSMRVCSAACPERPADPESGPRRRGRLFSAPRLQAVDSGRGSTNVVRPEETGAAGGQEILLGTAVSPLQQET